MQTESTEQRQSTVSDSSGDARVSGDSLAASSQSATLSERFAQGFDFKDPVEMLFMVDDDIASQTVKLHDWQMQFMVDFANPENVKDFPFQAEVRAANGSGKDKYILAACIVWLCMRYRKAYGVATNGSGNQLDNQTEFHIRNLCNKINQKFGFEIWKCNYRSYTCKVTESVITLFATDEPNKAEGFHPIETGSKLAIFASEAKAIPDSIFTALSRCLGVTHRIDVSSPGLPAGYFFNRCNMSVDRKSLKSIKDCPPTTCIQYHITAYDCSHITEVEIENFAQSLAAQGGRNSAVFKSGVLAEFGTTDEMTVITYTQVYSCKIAKVVWIPEAHNQAGLDLANGGSAESVLKIRNGNKILGTESFKFEDTEDNINYCEELFYKWELDNPESLIWGDCCGAGYPQLCALRKRGWGNIRFFDSRNASSRPKVYKNIITEMWFNVGLLFQRKELITDGDALTETQLVTRYYKINTALQHQLLSKLEQKAKGFPSPDRADALVYSLVGYQSTYKPKVPVSESDAPVPRPWLQSKPTHRFHQQMLTGRAETPKSRLPVRPDMSYLQSQLDELNRQRRLEN